ncbi:hypothetical protein AAG570_001483 [Ranatra chinensis]|uniref:Uncharacterized protein n=1 Tax=Ranatra chinensis TaxID=642074 RepID=A0ABD0Y8N6_9HEMI
MASERRMSEKTKQKTTEKGTCNVTFSYDAMEGATHRRHFQDDIEMKGGLEDRLGSEWFSPGCYFSQKISGHRNLVKLAGFGLRGEGNWTYEVVLKKLKNILTRMLRGKDFESEDFATEGVSHGATVPPIDPDPLLAHDDNGYTTEECVLFMYVDDDATVSFMYCKTGLFDTPWDASYFNDGLAHLTNYMGRKWGEGHTFGRSWIQPQATAYLCACVLSYERAAK